MRSADSQLLSQTTRSGRYWSTARLWIPGMFSPHPAAQEKRMSPGPTGSPVIVPHPGTAMDASSRPRSAAADSRPGKRLAITESPTSRMRWGANVTVAPGGAVGGAVAAAAPAGALDGVAATS